MNIEEIRNFYQRFPTEIKEKQDTTSFGWSIIYGRFLLSHISTLEEQHLLDIQIIKDQDAEEKLIMEKVKELEKQNEGLNNLANLQYDTIVERRERFQGLKQQTESRIKVLEEAIKKHRANMWGEGEDVKGSMYQVNNCIDEELYKVLWNKGFVE